MVVDESGRVEAVESGRKVGCIVSQVLYHEQVRALKKSPEWFVIDLFLSFFMINFILYLQLVLKYDIIRVLKKKTSAELPEV